MTVTVVPRPCPVETGRFLTRAIRPGFGLIEQCDPPWEVREWPLALEIPERWLEATEAQILQAREQVPEDGVYPVNLMPKEAPPPRLPSEPRQARRPRPPRAPRGARLPRTPRSPRDPRPDRTPRSPRPAQLPEPAIISWPLLGNLCWPMSFNRTGLKPQPPAPIPLTKYRTCITGMESEVLAFHQKVFDTFPDCGSARKWYDGNIDPGARGPCDLRDPCSRLGRIARRLLEGLLTWTTPPALELRPGEARTGFRRLFAPPPPGVPVPPPVIIPLVPEEPIPEVRPPVPRAEARVTTTCKNGITILWNAPPSAAQLLAFTENYCRAPTPGPMGVVAEGFIFRGTPP